MLITIAIVGGAIFTTVQGANNINSGGFESGELELQNTGHSDGTLQMEVRAASIDQVQVNKVTVSNDDGAEVVNSLKKIIPAGETTSLDSIGVADSNTNNQLDVEIEYSTGELNNLVAEGTLSGNIDVDTEAAEPGNGDWVFVDVSETPSNYMDTSGMSDFYLMKYEARNSGGTPVSETGTSIWTNINQTEAKQECHSIGGSLVSGRQWSAVAHQAAVNPDNWADDNVGSSIGSGGGLYKGNAGNTNSVSYDGSNPDPSTSNETKRTLELANNETVWDLSGNVWEWTSNSFKTLNGEYQSPRQNNAPGDESWHEINEITSWNGMTSSSATNSSWTGDEGIGRIFLNGDETYTDTGENGNVSAVRRGGYWDDGRYAGVFSASLGNAPSYSDGSIGFRCSLSS